MESVILVDFAMINGKPCNLCTTLREDGKIFFESSQVGGGVWYPAKEHDLNNSVTLLYPDLDNPLSKEEAGL